MKIRIGQYAFAVGAPYSAGHTLTQNEADALNGLRAENIRNNTKKRVDDALKGLAPGELLTPDAISDLQDQIGRYAADYVFGEKREPKGGIRKTPFELALRAVALERVETQARQQQVHLSSEEIEDLVETTMQVAAVIDEARRRVAKQQEIAQQALQELL